jgi:hypothetical protein
MNCEPPHFNIKSSQTESRAVIKAEREPTNLRDLARVDEFLGAQGRFAEGLPNTVED